MPELPEIETIRNGLQDLRGKKITKIFSSEKNLRIASTLNLSTLNGLIIKKIDRRARYLIIHLSKNHALIVHLGMSGKLVTVGSTAGENYKPQKHDHFICWFDDGSCLVYNDPRRFGFVDLIFSKNIAQHKMLGKLGVEPLSDDFNANYLQEKLKGKKLNIKTSMMDNAIVVGVGNIYINESLFAARILPTRSASSLSKTEISTLIKAIKNILQKAIKHGGSSISDYVNSQGQKGNFQQNFKVYGNEGKKCLICGGVITRIVQNGRSTFYCENCQK